MAERGGVDPGDVPFHVITFVHPSFLCKSILTQASAVFLECNTSTCSIRMGNKLLLRGRMVQPMCHSNSDYPTQPAVARRVCLGTFLALTAQPLDLVLLSPLKGKVGNKRQDPSPFCLSERLRPRVLEYRRVAQNRLFLAPVTSVD